MNKIEQLYELIQTDLPIDKHDLGHEAIKSANLFVKYIKMYTDENLVLKRLINKKNNLIQEKREYYSGTAPAEMYREKPFNIKVKTEAGLAKYIENDIDVNDFNKKILAQESVVELLHAIMDEIKRRGFAIKAAIDFHRFENGG